MGDDFIRGCGGFMGRRGQEPDLLFGVCMVVMGNALISQASLRGESLLGETDLIRALRRLPS